VVRPGDAVTELLLRLPAAERVRIAEALLDSLSPWSAQPSSEEVDAAWREESDRRIAAVRRGEAETIPVDVVFAEVARRLTG
jgi:putative addiction module component (TIGR02574 family)